MWESVLSISKDRHLLRSLSEPAAFAALLIDLEIRLGARAMVVQVPVQVLPIEAVDGVGVSGVDVAVADMFGDDRAVLGLHQSVVAALQGTAFGLLDEQLVKQLGDGAIDELRAVVGVEALDAKWELAQYAFSTGSR